MRFSKISAFFLAVIAAADAAVLRPINVLTYEAALSGRPTRRSDSALFADLAPAKQAQLIYGTPGANGQLFLAQMTLFAPSGLPIVMMERLEGLTTAVDCSLEGSGEIGVTWRDRQAYLQALKNWEWINEEATMQFLLVVNRDGCGPDAERAAYRIIDVHTDELKLVTKLKAALTPWKDITGSYSLDFGRASLVPVDTAKRLRVRGWKDFWGKVKDVAGKVVDKVKDVVGDIKDGAKDTAEKAVDGAKDATEKVTDGAKDAAEKMEGGTKDVVEKFKDIAKGIAEGFKKMGKDIGEIFEQFGDADLSEAIEFDVSGGEKGVRKNIFTDPLSNPPQLIIDCTNCFLVGKFRFQGKLEVDNFQIKDLRLALSPSGFSATAEIDTTIAAAYTPSELNRLTSTGASKNVDLLTLSGSNDIIEIPVPGAGMVIPQIFSLGVVMGVEAGFTIGFKGSLSFFMGMTVALPDAARLELNFADPKKSAVTGFDGATAIPNLELKNASATIEGSLFFRPKFAIKAEVTSVGELSADIKVGLPQINLGATMEYNENGVCEGATETTGAKFSVGGVLDVVVGMTGQILGIGGRLVEETLASFELFKKLEKCVPFQVPGVKTAGLLPSNTTFKARTIKPRKPSRVYRPVSGVW